MRVVAVTVAVLLAAAVALVLVRIVRGPSTLDRIVATDALLAITVGALATEAAYTRDATALPVLLGLSILGFAGSVSVARFANAPANAPASASANAPASASANAPASASANEPPGEPPPAHGTAGGGGRP